tara:strand:+ start:942 stop:2486 length:1545 start_codon:yes stop_codon:yes gene_type:complete
MATIIQSKRTNTANIPSTLEQGEFAYIYDTSNTDTDAGGNGGRLYIGHHTTNSNTPFKVGGAYYTALMDHTHGTVTASTALLVDSNKKLNELLVDNLTLNGNAITSTNTNGNITVTPHGTGDVIIDGLKHPQADGTAGHFLKTDGSGQLGFSAVATSTLTGTIANSQLAGSIPNSKLANDGITIGSTDTSLGDTITALAGMTQIAVDNITLNSNTISTTNSNGDLTLSPQGTGSVTVPSDYTGRAGFGSQSLAPKSYVDSVANGLDVKGSVRVATTANLGSAYNNSAGTLTNSGSQANIEIDGVTLQATNRVLVKNQSTAAQNGFYQVTNTGSGSANWVLTRTPDADAASELTSGAFTFAEEGTVNGDNGYVLSTNGAITLGTTGVVFEQFSGAGQITAGNGLTKSGNTINVVGTSGTITVSADALTIASNYVGQTSITTLGTIATGVWAGTDVAVAHGGTGLSAAAKGSVLVANSANTLSALDGGGSNDGVLFYTSSSDTISWATAIDGGSYS